MATTTLERKRETLFERVHSDSVRVDREGGVLRHVRVLGRKSKNGRRYSARALGEAREAYESLKVHVDHVPRTNPDQERAFSEWFGELRGCVVERDGVYADLPFLKSHPLAEQVCEAAERFPNKFGLSHNADGELVKVNGEWVVESINRVRSVDIVGCPATNSGLFESKGQRMRTLREQELAAAAVSAEPVSMEQAISNLEAGLMSALDMFKQEGHSDPEASGRDVGALIDVAKAGIQTLVEKLRSKAGVSAAEPAPDELPADVPPDEAAMESLRADRTRFANWLRQPEGRRARSVAALVESRDSLPDRSDKARYAAWLRH